MVDACPSRVLEYYSNSSSPISAKRLGGKYLKKALKQLERDFRVLCQTQSIRFRFGEKVPKAPLSDLCR